MIDADKIQIGDKLRVLCPYLLDDAVHETVTVVAALDDSESIRNGYWVHQDQVEKDDLKFHVEKFTLVATNTKYSDIQEGDIVEVACLSDEQINKWDCEYLIGSRGVVTRKSKSIHVDVGNDDEWCLQPENLRVVEKARLIVGNKELVLPPEYLDPNASEERKEVYEKYHELIKKLQNDPELVPGLRTNIPMDITPQDIEGVTKQEQYTGASSDYYKVFVKNPTTLSEPYEAECNDIIEALEMDFAEGNAFKAIWRKAKARQGVKKKGYDNGVYDSEKVIFFGERMLVKAKDGDNESI